MKKYKGIFRRGNKLWMTLRVKPGKRGWQNLPTHYPVGEEQSAATLRRLTQERLDAGQDLQTAAGGIPTVRAFGKTFLEKRRLVGVRSVDDDESRLRTHVYPVLGAMLLDQVEARHIAALIEQVRALRRAPRTTRNIYSVVRALFRDAQIAGLVAENPCILTHYQLGKV